MFGDGPLTFREFATREPLPLATVHDAVLDFLRDRDDAVLCGAQAVNAYVNEPRMTQDIDILSPCAQGLAHDVCVFLNKRFHIIVRVRVISPGVGYRVYQVRESLNRHFVDLRPVTVLPPNQRVQGVLVVCPPELLAEKMVSMFRRPDMAHSLLDQADVLHLLQTFPGLKALHGPVAERLQAAGATAQVIAGWEHLVAQEFESVDEADKFGG